MPTGLISGVFAVSVGFATDSLAQTVSDSTNPLSSLGVFSAVIAAFLFMLKRSDGRDSARIKELTKIIVDLREDLKREKMAHEATLGRLLKALERERSAEEDAN